MADERGMRCVGTGHCCSKGLCKVSATRLPHLPMNTPCPKLTWSDEAERFLCGYVVEAPNEAERQKVLKSIRAGDGCVGPWLNERARAAAQKRTRLNVHA